MFPLARKSYVSMARMKELQPEMEKLKERAGDDRQKLQQEMMALYKKEKVNPAAGCLPILMQIPIFFSLYKVIFVTIELRHAPWFGPFQDLSAPDPTSIFNFYGWLPWDAPPPESLMALIFIGILPLLLGVSMWFQQKLNPAPTDETQRMIFAWMPWVFMFMLGGFARRTGRLLDRQQRHHLRAAVLHHVAAWVQARPSGQHQGGDTARARIGEQGHGAGEPRERGGGRMPQATAAETPAPPKPKGPTPKRKKKRRK